MAVQSVDSCALAVSGMVQWTMVDQVHHGMRIPHEASI